LEDDSLLLLTRKEIQSLLSFPDYVEAVRDGFRLHALRQSLPPVLAHVDCPSGEFHIKAGGLLDPKVFAVKINGAFFDNPRHNLPSIQGMILLASAENGSPLALMDSVEITVQRTAAATAVAAEQLALRDSYVCTLCGTGNQAGAQLKAILYRFPIKQVYVWSRRADRASAFANKMQAELGIDVTPSEDLSGSLRKSTICVTCTSSKQAFLPAEAIPSGMFIAAVGADSPAKQELEPQILAKAKLIADLRSQAIAVGETHHAIEAGLIGPGHICAELGELIAGLRSGREGDEEIIVFDSTGTALQDVAAAHLVYERAVQSRLGTEWAPS
jgi:alanine dehydrogenase